MTETENRKVVIWTAETELTGELADKLNAESKARGVEFVDIGDTIIGDGNAEGVDAVGLLYVPPKSAVPKHYDMTIRMYPGPAMVGYKGEFQKSENLEPGQVVDLDSKHYVANICNYFARNKTA